MSTLFAIPFLVFNIQYLLFLIPYISSSASGLCQSDQSLALLQFKKSLDLVTYPFDRCADNSYNDQISVPRTVSWNSSTDGCLWGGVTCDKLSGQVVELDLSCSWLSGIIHPNSTLFHLSHLRRLNLAWNDIHGSLSILYKFGDLPYLTHLNLSSLYFSGKIPSEIIRLPNLVSLDLTRLYVTFEHDGFRFLCENSTQLRELVLDGINLYSSIPSNLSSLITTLSLRDTGVHGSLPSRIFHFPNLQKLYLSFNENLTIHFPNTRWNSSSSLRYLDISYTAGYYPGIVKFLGNVSRLEHLGLENCGLSGKVSDTILNLKQLTTLYLSANHLDSGFADLFTRLGKLERLSLRDNIVTDHFPYPNTNLTQLKVLDIRNNSIYGTLPSWLFNLSTLYYLKLGDNQLQGSIEASLSKNKDLLFLDLSSNNFSGAVEVSMLANLKMLKTLSLSNNHLSIVTDEKTNSTTWSENLMKLDLQACNLTEFSFLRNSKSLESLYLSHNKLKGRIPEWAWSNWVDTLGVLDLSHNSLTSVEGIHQLQSLYMIDLRSNLLQGQLPVLSTTLQYLLASNNKFSGEIPLTLCNVSGISILDLANNNLSGSVPQCLVNWYMEVLDLHDNEFCGSVPTHFEEENQLHTLNLRGNRLEGTIPPSLANCAKLQVLDLANNILSDTFPEWLMAELPQLQVLSLKSNKFHGTITSSKTNKHIFSQLKIVDLSHNEFNGVLPVWLFESLLAMKSSDEARKPRSYFGDSIYYKDSLELAWKGNQLTLESILTADTIIDLSCNKFEGNTPGAIGQLISLNGLNLSHNMLGGHIPRSLGKLTVLEWLDLSSNQLVGGIPNELASITFLGVFNVSNNQLTGCIPKGSQFNTFENSSYLGNDGLLGFPLTKDCAHGGKIEMPPEEEEGKSSILEGCTLEVVLMGFGCGVAFGMLGGSLNLLTRKRYSIATVADEVAYEIAMKLQRKRSKPGRR